MEEISDEFENWPDRIINFELHPFDCWKKASVWLLSSAKLIQLDQIFLKLVER